MKEIFDAMFGNVDENETYYTEQMFQQELGRFAIYIMLKKGLIDGEEYEQLEKDFKEQRNKVYIEELKERYKNV